MHSHLESLEARTLMAFAGTFTDVDGDTYKVQLNGPGEAAVTTSMGGTTGFIQSLAITNTTAASKLSISVQKVGAGDGRVNAHTINASILRGANLAKVDITSGGFFTDVGQLTLGNVADNAAIEDSLNPSLANLGKRTASFGSIGDDVTLDFGNTFSSITIADGPNVDFSIVNVGLLSSKARLIGIVSADAITEIRAAGVLRIRGSVDSAVKKISAAAILQPPTGQFEVGGAIGTLTTKGDLTADITAFSFGSVFANNFNSELTNLGVDAKGFAFKSLKFTGDAIGAFIGVANLGAAAGTPGIIGSLSARSWTAGTIREAAIGTFTIKNDMLNADFEFSGANVPLVIKTFTVGNGATGDIQFNGNAGAFKVGTAGLPAMRGNAQTNLNLSSESDSNGIKSITITQPFNNELSVDAGFVGTISSKAASTQLNIFLQSADSKGFALKSATFAGSVDDTLSALAPGAKIGTLTVGSFGECTVDAGTFGTVTAKNKAVASAINLTARTAPPVGFSMGTLDFRGGLDESTIRAAGSINKFSTLKFTGSTHQLITAGSSTFNTVALDAVVDLNTFITASINKIDITGAFGVDPVMNDVIFVADTFGKVTINGRTNITGQNDGGFRYGFAGRHFGKFSFKLDNGQPSTPTIPTAPGFFNPFQPMNSGNFFVKVLA